MTTLSTHILNTSTGTPVEGVSVTLEHQTNNEWAPIGHGVTNSDGRIGNLNEQLEKGAYRLIFAVGDYFNKQQLKPFYPEITVAFNVNDDRHHHIPLLLSPYGYSTYRGS